MEEEAVEEEPVVDGGFLKLRFEDSVKFRQKS
jgi:hypothetical protein